MILGIALALSAAALAFALARAGSVAYALFFLAFLPFLTLDPSQGGLVSIDGLQSGDNVLWKLSVRAATMAGIAVLAVRRMREVLDVLTRSTSLPVLALFTWAVLGLPRAHDPWVSFVRLGELLAFFVTGAVLYVEAGRAARESDVLRWHALAVLPLLAVTVAFAFLRPEIAFHESASGIRRMGHKFMNSNVLGFAATVSLLWSSFVLRARLLGSKVPEQRRADLFAALLAFAVGAYVLYHARSRTASLTAAGAMALLWFPWPGTRDSWEDGRARALFVGLALLCICVAVPLAGGIQEWFLRGGSAQDIATGTGRTGLWSDLLTLQVPKAPLLGAGYLNLSDAGGFEHAGHHWNNAHNSYLFALVSTGFPGLLCVLSIVALPIAFSVQRLRSPDPDERETAPLALALHSVIAVASITGFGVVGYPNVAMLFHYGLYTWSTRPLSKRARTAPAAAAAASFTKVNSAPEGCMP